MNELSGKDTDLEELRLSDVGRGLNKHLGQMGYLHAVMYHCICEPEEYKAHIKRDIRLVETYQILRSFLRETSTIELNELSCVAADYYESEYFQIYGNKTIVGSILEKAWRVIVRIGKSEFKKANDEKNDQARDYAQKVLDLGELFKSDLIMHTQEAAKRFTT